MTDKRPDPWAALWEDSPVHERAMRDYLAALAGREANPRDWVKARRFDVRRNVQARRGAARGRATVAERRKENALLLADVKKVRRAHPRWGRPRIARELLPTWGRTPDKKDPDDERQQLAALTKRIERAEKSLDK